MEIKQLTFTRFIAAFIIIIFHYGQKAFPFNSGMLYYFAREGAFSVSYFFCLSGYILTHVYYNSDLNSRNKKAFFIKRFARIYPLYLLGFLAALIIGILLFHSYPKGYSIILQIFALHSWVPGIILEMNYPGWSLSVELFFYACFPFLLRMFSNSSNKKLILFTLTIWFISAISHILLKLSDVGTPQFGEFLLYNPLFHINTFIFGMAACIIVKRSNTNVSRDNSYLFILLTSAILLFIIIATNNLILPWVHNGLLAPLFAALIISLHLGNHLISKFFALKPLIFLGEISYGMYILQHPVRLLFEQIIQKMNIKIDETSIFYFYAMTLTAISALIFLLIEKPLRKMIVKKLA